MSWIIKNYIKETRENETGAQVYPPGLRHPVAFIYPNVYHLGMSNLGMHILYQMINERGDSACERFFCLINDCSRSISKAKHRC